MNILMAASEMTPFARTGEFADDMLALPGELRKLGHEVSVVLPFYRCIRENKSLKTERTKVKFSVQVGPGRYPCDIYEAVAPNGVQVSLVSREECLTAASCIASRAGITRTTPLVLSSSPNASSSWPAG